MKNSLSYLFFSSVATGLLLFKISVSAQPFIGEIKAFKQQDSLQVPAKGQILFVGSSSFRMWKDLQDYFPKKKILNRGFGGASLPDVIRYADDIIFPYQPKKIVIYCGENDIASSDTLTGETVTGRFIHLFRLIRERIPGIEIIYVSIKPSPSRAQMMSRISSANIMIRQFLAEQANAKFVDVYHLMLDTTGRPLPHLFIADSLHMNANGYRIWQRALKRHI